MRLKNEEVVQVDFAIPVDVTVERRGNQNIEAIVTGSS